MIDINQRLPITTENNTQSMVISNFILSYAEMKTCSKRQYGRMNIQFFRIKTKDILNFKLKQICVYVNDNHVNCSTLELLRNENG